MLIHAHRLCLYYKILGGDSRMETVRIGLIGAGHRGYFVPLWNDTNGRSKITALAEIDETKIDRFKKYVADDIYFTDDYHKLLAREDVDAVVVLTPDHMHREHAVAVLEAGKDLYLEKPMAISIEGCDEILEVLERTGRKLMIGFNMRYMPMYQTMQQIIKDGFIGDVKSIWVRHFVGTGGKMYFEDWHRNSKFTNSLLLQKASHDIDVIHMLANSYTKKVSAFGGLDYYDSSENFVKDGLIHRTEHPIDVEDNSVVIMELENGIKASYMQCHFTPEYSRSYTVIGTKGRLENNDADNTIVLKPRTLNEQSNIKEVTWKIKQSGLVHDGADIKIVEAFLDYILEDKEPVASPIDGMKSVAVGVKATESLRHGGGVQYIP